MTPSGQRPTGKDGEVYTLRRIPCAVGGSSAEAWSPGGDLYKALLLPLVPYGLKGVVWYQGEANTDQPQYYSQAMETLIAAWRRDFGSPDLPFVYMQLPRIGGPPAADAKVNPGDGWALTREAQTFNLAIPDAPQLAGLPLHPSMPGSRAGGNWLHLYNGMIAPLVKFPIKGAIWYQGENNSEEIDSYVAKMDAMISSWRKNWGIDFPFYYVQLANWLKPSDIPSGEDNQFKWQRCRLAQLKVLSQVPKTGMAVIIDCGDADDIHPRDKFDVGERLALWALAKDYGKTGLVCSGPLYKGMKVEGSTIKIRFDSVGSGLMVAEKKGLDPAKEVNGGALKKYAIAGADKVWHWAEAKIDGETVVVSSPEVPAPVAVRYAYHINPEGCNLYNKEGLPASPFKMEG